MKIRTTWNAALATACFAAVVAGCGMMEKEPAGPLPSGTLTEGVATVQAKVKKVDLKGRNVTLEMPNGETRIVHVSDEVKNLPQVKIGDTVTATYYQSVGYDVIKKGEGETGVASAEDFARAKPGEKPAAAGARVTAITGKIKEINKKNGTFTIEWPEGDSDTITARDPKNLDIVKVGDLVQVTVTEAVGIVVESPK